MPAYHYQQGDRPLDGFTIQHALGRGGFGEVYFAVSDAGREVALKSVLNYEDIELRGIGHCMNLKSPHLVMIFDVKQGADGTPWVIMEYVAGPSLRSILDAAPNGIEPQQAAFFLRQLAKGVDYLHDAGIVHRDLKPHNVFFEDGVVKIGDYGLSKVITGSHASGHTMTVGSVHYMAPEISMGKYDKTVDLYALGVMLYEMLTGKPPFVGESIGEVLMKHLSGSPDLDRLPELFQEVVQKAMKRDPAQRYQSARAMVDAIANASTGMELADEGSPISLSLIGHSANAFPHASRSPMAETISAAVSDDTADSFPIRNQSPFRRDKAVSHETRGPLHTSGYDSTPVRLGLSLLATILLMAFAFAIHTETLVHYGDEMTPLNLTVGTWTMGFPMILTFGTWFIGLVIMLTLNMKLAIFSPRATDLRSAILSRMVLLSPIVFVLIFRIRMDHSMRPFVTPMDYLLAMAAAVMLMDWRRFVDPVRSDRVATFRTLLCAAISGFAIALNDQDSYRVVMAMAATTAAAITVQLASIWRGGIPTDSSIDHHSSDFVTAVAADGNSDSGRSASSGKPPDQVQSLDANLDSHSIVLSQATSVGS